MFINNGVNISFKDNFVFGNYVGLFKYVTNDSSLFLSSVIENNTLVDVQSFDTSNLVMQDSVWNCGPACLVNLFKIYGLDVSQDDIASISGTSFNGTSLYGLYLACVHYGFNVSAWYLNSSDIKVNDLVVLLLDGEYHFSLVKCFNESVVCLADSAFGVISLDWDSFDGLFTGYVLDLNSSLERGLRVNVNQIMNVTGTFLPLVVVGYFAVAATIAVAGYLVYTFSPQIRSAGNWVYNKAKKVYPRVRSAVAAVVCTGVYTLSRGWNKKPSYKPNTKSKSVDQVTRINKELNSFINGKSGSVSYYPSSGKYYIKGYGTFTTSKLVSKGVSSKLLAEVQYKVLYGIYIKSKSKERNKVAVPDDLDSYKLFKKDLDAFRNGMYKFLPGPDGGDDDNQIASLLIKDARNNYKYGYQLIKEGEKLKGATYISFALFEASLIPAIINNYLNPI